ncbi:MAG: sigma-54 dependent transcriptional regulator [Deltaproteobacteria bacterium]|nr:sigma-54 dependent transcriptional regulator [Deltaproteobacteria bacterium]
MTSPPTILVVDDDATIRLALTAQLADEGYRTIAAESIAAATAALRDAAIDLVLLDIRLKDGDGLTLLEQLRATRPALPVIIATAFGDSARAIRAMRLGAFEYVTKPFDLEALLATVSRAVATPVTAAAPIEEPSSPLVGSSPRMLDVWKLIGRAAASEVPVLITGETGVGKELVARAIHDHGPRRDRPFIAVNLAAIPAPLIESELFGHEKGAFTGAATRRDGRFTLADGGTLFLDEIADLDAALQTKLLRVLEDGGFERVGGSAHLTSTARIISATSRPVEPGAAGATLRTDLFYRLGVLRLDVPPLRARRQDVPALVQAFLRDAPPPRRAISEAALERLIAHDWPGNVRELRHVLAQAAALTTAEVIDVGDLALRERPAPARPADLDLKAALDRVERSMIEQALAVAKGNRSEAARLLGIRRALLYDRLKHFGIERVSDEDG